MWGRKRPEQRPEETYDEMLAEGRAAFADLMHMADETHELAGRTFGMLDEMRRETEELLSGDRALPTAAARAQFAEHERLWESLLADMSAYEERRRRWADEEDIESADFDELSPDHEYFADYIHSRVPIMERLNKLIGELGELQASLAVLREQVAPIRERSHAAMEAATTEIAWAGLTGQSSYALQARLNAVGDRLRELDAGVGETGLPRSIPDQYRDAEREIAEIRDSIPRPPF
ncbi:hypothetical protein AB0I49_06045 [Streptomyces sp. NPDC050617]|uniref:hypothetical protein n=1 Tax=Streptomyces sp. NPDC050617 TaxID=3154628 RepID=UPI003448938A